MVAVHALEELCRAALRGELPTIEKLLAEGLDVNAPDGRGMSPLHWAVWGGQLESVRLLLSHGGDPNLPGGDGPHSTPYWYAAEDFGLQEIATVLQEAGGVLHR